MLNYCYIQHIKPNYRSVRSWYRGWFSICCRIQLSFRWCRLFYVNRTAFPGDDI